MAGTTMTVDELIAAVEKGTGKPLPISVNEIVAAYRRCGVVLNSSNDNVERFFALNIREYLEAFIEDMVNIVCQPNLGEIAEQTMANHDEVHGRK